MTKIYSHLIIYFNKYNIIRYYIYVYVVIKIYITPKENNPPNTTAVTPSTPSTQ